MISATTAWGSATGTGITGPYAIPFALYSQSHLTVLQVSNGIATVMNLGTDYTFTAWSPDNKGYVASPAITFTVSVAGGVLIIFLLAPPGTQLVSNSNFSTYSPTMQEQQADILDQKTLQLLEWAKKSIKAPDWEANGLCNLTLPPVASRKNLLVGMDNNGNVSMVSAVPAGSVSFTTTGQIIAAIASVTSLLQTLGINIVANLAAVLALVPVSNTVNLAFQLDTSDLWIYNFTSVAWLKLAQVQP